MTRPLAVRGEDFPIPNPKVVVPAINARMEQGRELLTAMLHCHYGINLVFRQRQSLCSRKTEFQDSGEWLLLRPDLRGQIVRNA